MKTSIFLVAALAVGAAGARAEEVRPAKVLDRKSPDYVRCERHAPVGSLIKSVKICRTNAEWARFAEEHGKEARDMVERNQGRPPGN